MTHSVEMQELFTALSLAQGEGLAALKDTEGQIGNTLKKYADLASCWEACRGPLARHGICVIQVPCADGPRITIHTVLGHKSGQYVTGELTMTSTVPTPQGIGSTITYARRYSLCSMVGIAPEDDDGAAGSQGSKELAAKVGEEKLRKLRETKPLPPASPPDGLGVSIADLESPVEFKRMMEGFEAIKAEFLKLGRADAYYQVLADNEYKHANEIRPLRKARDIYRQMGVRKRELLDEILEGGVTHAETTVG